LRLQLLRHGYEPIPIVAHDAPGRSPGKRPNLAQWKSLRIDEVAVRAWRHDHQRRNPGTGLRCGRLRAVDIDILDVELAEQVHALALKLLGPTPLRRVGKTPKILLCYRVAEPQAKRETDTFVLPDGSNAQIEILGSGQQLVAYGVHPETRQEYRWLEAGPDIVPLADLPVLHAQDEAAFLAAAEQLIRAAGGRPGSQVKREGTHQAAESGSSASTAAQDRRRSPHRDFFRQVNSAALANIEPWFKRLFPTGYWQPNATKPPGAWRVRSDDLKRGLEEDIAVHVTEGGHD
jgi:hypothetical protein